LFHDDFLTPSKWRVNAKIEDFRKITKLGSGSYGDVFQVEDIDAYEKERTYAMKVINV
jgi:hypothetical protein